ncbi:hypothetical protein [Paenibacillus humicola]|uniref:hypothetical protein n=1 Tax=Paenibacillus humicola TaxID=3110540 RepID=UPI00237B5C40|nr:hypothetical protein [Paenibacillus humicola]
MLQQVVHQAKLYAIIVSRHFSENGVHFVTPSHFSQQLAFMKHPAGKTIQPHIHNLVEREVHYTQEVLFIKKGRLRVDFYDDSQRYFESCVLEAGDTILLAFGGHGFEVLDEVEMIEVKQGPYAADQDKTRFTGIDADQVILKNKT